MAERERTIFDVIEEALKAHGVPADEEIMKRVRDKIYAKLKDRVDPREIEREIKTNRPGKLTTTAYEIVGKMIRSREINKGELETKRAMAVGEKTEVSKLSLTYGRMAGIDKNIADTMVMLGVKPTKENVARVRGMLQAKLRNEANPQELKAELKSDRPGIISDAASDIIKDMKKAGELPALSKEELEEISKTRESLRKALRKPKLLSNLKKKRRR